MFNRNLYFPILNHQPRHIGRQDVLHQLAELFKALKQKV